jgi:hypothetical protein
MSYYCLKAMKRHRQSFLSVALTALAVAIMGASPSAVTPVPKNAVVIYNPGNGDYTGFRIVVEADGQANAIDAAGSASKYLQSDVVDRFFNDLSAATPLAQPPGERCPVKAESSATGVEINAAVVINWRGRNWSALTCGSDMRLARLIADATAIQHALYVQAYRERPMYVYVGNHYNAGQSYSPSVSYAGPGYGSSGAYTGDRSDAFYLPRFSNGYSTTSSPFNGSLPGSYPSGTLPTTNPYSGLPNSSMTFTNPYSSLPGGSVTTTSPYSGGPYGSSPFSGGP